MACLIMTCLKSLRECNFKKWDDRKNALIFSCLVLSMCALVLFGSVSVSAADLYHASNQGNAVKNSPLSESVLAATEQKLLGKVYAGDPLTKRLQRLELLTFGSTQYGRAIDRWHKIQSFLQNKNSIARRSSGVNGGVSSSLNELEKYVFKTTSPSLSTSKRLDKLETKLFGQPSTNIAPERRIARLEKTLGLSESANEMADLPNQLLPPGVRGFNASPYFGRGQSGMPMFGFGFNNDDMNDGDLNQLESQMNRMFGEMERQMQEQMQQAPKPQRESIPSYNDPNYI